MIAPVALAVLSTAWAPPGLAGPATYDPATRAFRLSYTFAGGSSFGSLDGAVPWKNTTEEEARVRSLVADASPILSEVTDQRGIGEFNYVDTLEKADIVFVMTGNPSSPGWSTMRSTDGRPGHLVIYYKTIFDTTRQDAAFSVVHLLGHYLFGLADEYNYANFPLGCPTTPGPGCIMDNYRPGMRGWSGRYCDDSNHNRQPTQEKSCQALVDQFFKEHGDPPKVVDHEAEAFRKVKQQANSLMLKYARSAIQGNSGRHALPADPMTESVVRPGRHTDRAELRARAEEILRQLIGEPKDARSKEKFEFRVTELVDSASARLVIERAGGIAPWIEERLLNKAAELAAQYPEGQLELSTRLTIIRKKLLELAIGSLGQTPATEARQLIDNIAVDAVRNSKHE